jgi:hypothetical protein
MLMQRRGILPVFRLLEMLMWGIMLVLLERIFGCFLYRTVVWCGAFSISYVVMVGVPIVPAATLYTDVETGVKYILVINEALHMTNLPYFLLNPNQIRYAGNQVFDNPFDHPNAVHCGDYPVIYNSCSYGWWTCCVAAFSSDFDDWNPNTILLPSLRVVEGSAIISCHILWCGWRCFIAQIEWCG